MNNKYKYKKGDISLLVTLLVCSIILILLAPMAQKVSVESRISKENLMSQQAVQAAKTGLDAWKYKVSEDLTIDLNTTDSRNNIDWLVLDSSLGIEYKVDYYPRFGTQPAYIVGIGRVKKNNFTIERTLEEEFISTP